MWGLALRATEMLRVLYIFRSFMVGIVQSFWKPRQRYVFGVKVNFNPVLRSRTVTLQSRGAKRRGNVRWRHSGDVPWHVTRVYPQSIFRPRKLRLAELIVGWKHDCFYFIPGPPNPTFLVRLIDIYGSIIGSIFSGQETNKQTRNTRSISNMHERKERFAQKYSYNKNNSNHLFHHQT